MTARVPPANSASNNRQKQVLAAVLGVVFIGVVWLQLGQEPADSVLDTGMLSSNPPQPATRLINAPSPQAADATVSPLPPVELEEILAHDPFRCAFHAEAAERERVASAVPATLQDGRAAEGYPQPLELSVDGIVTGGRRAAALIGATLYHEHDILENGWQIVAIKPRSILVKPVNNSSEFKE